MNILEHIKTFTCCGKYEVDHPQRRRNTVLPKLQDLERIQQGPSEERELFHAKVSQKVFSS